MGELPITAINRMNKQRNNLLQYLLNSKLKCVEELLKQSNLKLTV
jgi:hypothetical protein